MESKQRTKAFGKVFSAILVIFIAILIALGVILRIQDYNQHFPELPNNAPLCRLTITEATDQDSPLTGDYGGSQRGQLYCCRTYDDGSVFYYHKATDYATKLNYIDYYDSDEYQIAAFWYGYDTDYDHETITLTAPSHFSMEQKSFGKVTYREKNAVIQLISSYDHEQHVLAELPIINKSFSRSSNQDAYTVELSPGCAFETFHQIEFINAVNTGKIPLDVMFNIPTDADYICKASTKVYIK